ncbi:hypothetical protein ACFFIF_10780 [Vagococcus entomophilus]|uniref:Uncharacterized protein n=1 Tax=Vagococcus entomophilus TaxID=1160095 RepID=A0A430AF12_9ENTE|nr:hypothetical protein [Vagococcus entomophilus]RSU06175.1 hypothetical protein CBF30_10685 [Vagococcus entomophilus]
MTTDKQYRQLSDDIYKAEKLHPRYDKTLKEGAIKEYGGVNYQVLKVEDNTSNGMQAMAVAPVNKADKVDMSKVVITYAGTNSDDNKDIQTKILIKKHLLKNTKFFFARYCHYNMLGVEST